ncbi:glycosyltransferase [Domibacillus sp. PGB-M46]|uniref:glycosyltransferase family 2 protein n=1 Tax=Domibacillus sp. PGB-M46 TaxID=2910255 RepID=UPI001F56140D|nr:glycosyltransferase family 2 protein [Domibacillus sp. PGB-M46]MCI2255191.1 glycosyltransferase [Domibacillus sp. PGB-M46]
MTEVSIVVPIFNAGQKLNKCIRSILNQSFKDIEVILVNDGSTDCSLSICNKYKNLDERIVIINEKNEGSIAARRKGIEASTSPYVMFVDADDWVHKDIVKLLYTETKSNDLDVSICNMYKVVGGLSFIKKENNKKYFLNSKVYVDSEILNELVVAYFHGHPFPSSLCAKLYKREVLKTKGAFLEKITFLGDDLFYNLEIFLKSKRVKLINQPLYFYRAGGFTSKYMPNLFSDMVNGYQIQREIIDNYYKDSRERHCNGISIMLLNTFKTCLFNLFNSSIRTEEKKDMLRGYVNNDILRKCIKNKGSLAYFPKEYLQAIENKNIDYLYDLGRAMHKKKKPKMALLKLAAKAHLL